MFKDSLLVFVKIYIYKSDPMIWLFILVSIKIV